MIFPYYRKLVSLLVIGGGIIGALCLFIATSITFYEVFMRYALKSPTTWSLDYGIYLVMWGTMLGASYTLKWHGHVGVEVIVAKLSSKVQKIIKIIVYFLVLIFCITLTWTATQSCVEAYEFREVTLSYTRTPLYIPLSSIAVGSGLLVLEIISQLSEMLQKEGSRK